MMLCSVIFLACYCLNKIQAVDESPRIIIIGSGASGIAAASRLFQNGFNNVTILEAENRIGGRVYTTRFGDYWVDLGGQWVTGEEDNVAFELAWPMGLLDHSKKDISLKFSSSSGVPMNEDAANNMFLFFNNLTQSEIPEEYANKSIGDYYKPKLNEFFLTQPEVPENHREPLTKMMDLVQMANDAGDTWYQVAAEHLDEVTCPGDQAINWKDRGYSTILDILMKKIPNPDEELPVLNNTVLNTEVAQINYNVSGGPLMVITSKGDEYFAEHVIVTPSLGVLKSDYETLFHPPLPEDKIKAIKGLTLGSVSKIYLLYPEPWWENSIDKIFMWGFYWTDEDRNELANDPEKSWLLSVYSLVDVEHKPRLLCAWLSGAHAREMERVPEERVFSQIKELINRFLGKSYNLTEPTAMIRTQWYTNKHFRGTYSYRSMETQKSGVKSSDLAYPITRDDKPVVLFAGEATNPKYPGMVHGAIGSGWREADRLIELYADKKTNGETSQSG